MNWLSQSLRSLGEGPGLAAPPWQSLASVVKPRPGNLIMVLGEPGAGKSLFALAWSLGLRTPTRLISLDTSLSDQAARIIANRASVSQEDVLAQYAGYASLADSYEERILPLDIAPTPEQIEEIIRADREVWGETPLVIVDDVARLDLDDAGGERSYSAYIDAFATMHQVAMREDAVIIAIHHIKNPEGGKVKPNLFAAKFGGHYESQIILFLTRPNSNTLRVHILKNRNGKAHPQGEMYVDLRVQYDRAQISDDVYGTQDFLWGVQ